LATESNAARTDSERTVHPAVSKKRLVIQLGGTALVAKLADDLSEEALAATAGSARWYGLAASTTFLLLQKGREVRLKPGEVIEVDLVREGSPLPVVPAAR
jgi:phage gp45-like